MYESQLPYRALFECIHEYEGDSLFGDVLLPWNKNHPAEIEWLREFSERRGTPIPPASDEELCRLYALGRVNETLLLRFQTGDADGSDWPGPAISGNEYVRFMEALGLTPADRATFSPFFHEIVTIQPATAADHPVSMLRTIWPGLGLGSMMFSRAGVEVMAGKDIARKEIAEHSALYWAYRRKNRRTHDLGKEWGSNSQWRTTLRRDYKIGDKFFYNVDGKYDISTEAHGARSHDNLDESERLELLLNRCLLSSTKRHDDLFPYDDYARLPDQL